MRRPSSISSGSRIAAPLIDSPPRDSSIVRGIAFRQCPSGSPRQSIESSGPPIARCTITGSPRRTPAVVLHRYVAHEEVLLRAVARQVDRARPRAAAWLDHHRVGVGLLLGQHRRRRGQPQPRKEQVGLVLVVGRTRHFGRGHERRQQTLGTRQREHLDVEVGERDHRADAVALAQLPQERHVAGVGDRRRRGAHLRRVLCRRQRVGVRPRSWSSAARSRRRCRSACPPR